MFVSAVDQKGEPVEGLGPGDFVIREDGAAREVLRVSRATEPIDIAILVDDSAASNALIPRVREALKAFTGTMSKGNQIAIVGLADRPRILANYTANTKLLQDAIGLLLAANARRLDAARRDFRSLEGTGKTGHAASGHHSGDYRRR